MSVCSSVFQDCAPIPVGGVSRVPDREWPQHRQLAAVFHNTTGFVDSETVAEFCEDILVLRVNESSYANLKWDVKTLKPLP